MIRNRLLPTSLTLALLLGFSCGAVACSSDGVGGSPSLGQSSAPGEGGPAASALGSSGTNDGTASGRCVDAINARRASLGRAPLARWSDEESCASDQSRSDSMSGKAHGAFTQCGEHAQNECPGWGGPPETMIGNCLDAMWAEGPGGGHYDNMANEGYTKVACGFHVLPDGRVWAVQDFR